MKERQRIQLGEAVQLDAANESLEVCGSPVQLRPKVYGVLRYLVDHPDRIVTKDELLEAIWSDTVVGDSVLKVCIRELRAALGDEPKAPRFIATVHRRGYRYVGMSSPPVEAPSTRPVQEPTPEPVPSKAHFVARAAELRHLEESLAVAQSGERRTVFVSGPSGIGKTALVDEAKRRFSSSKNTRVVRGRCQETLGAKEPYLPFLECVRDLVKDSGDTDSLRRMAPTWHVQFPWLVEDSDRAALERELHGATGSRMLRELDVFLGELTREETVVLVVEDMHWSDTASLDLLSFLATRDTPARLLMVIVTRSIELIVEDHPLRDIKRQLASHGRCSELPLELLETEDVGVMIEQRFRDEAVSPEIASWLHGRTEGHPLFVIHLLEHLVSTQALCQIDGEWKLTEGRSALAEAIPQSLPKILDKNIERYAGDERLALEGAALAGYEFGVHSIAHATDLDPERAEQLCEGIAVAGALIAPNGVSELPDGTVVGSYRFTHALLRDSLRRSIPPARRVRWQRRLAERGEALFQERAHEIAAQLAIHFAEARLYEKAIRYHLTAAGNARRAFSNPAAHEHLQAAFDLLPQVDGPPGPLTQEIQLEIARTFRASGDLHRAADTYERIATDAPSPEVAAEAWLLAAGVRSWQGRVECLSDVERALALVEPHGDTAILAHARGCAAYWRLLWDGWDPDGRGSCEEALRLAEEVGRSDHMVAHRARLAFFLALEGRYVEAAAAAERADEEAVVLGDASESLLAHFYRGLALLLGDRMEQAKSHTTEARDMAELNGHVPWGVLFDVQLAWIAAESGDSAALPLAEAAAERAKSLGHDFIDGFGRAIVGLTAASVGERKKARAQLKRKRPEPFLMDWLCELISLVALTRLGDDKARVALAQSAEQMGTTRFAAWSQVPKLPKNA